MCRSAAQTGNGEQTSTTWVFCEPVRSHGSLVTRESSRSAVTNHDRWGGVCIGVDVWNKFAATDVAADRWSGGEVGGVEVVIFASSGASVASVSGCSRDDWGRASESCLRRAPPKPRQSAASPPRSGRHRRVARSTHAVDHFGVFARKPYQYLSPRGLPVSAPLVRHGTWCRLQTPPMARSTIDSHMRTLRTS